MGGFKELKIYQKSFELAMEIFEVTKSFPTEEKYGLTSQIRRSSRSVCSNMAEGYRKKIYKAHFISKMSDCDMENSETSVWLDFALACKYIDEATHENLIKKTKEIGYVLDYMIKNSHKFTGNKNVKK
jgi:four helix bundle protein